MRSRQSPVFRLMARIAACCVLTAAGIGFGLGLAVSRMAWTSRPDSAAAERVSPATAAGGTAVRKAVSSTRSNQASDSSGAAPGGSGITGGAAATSAGASTVPARTGSTADKGAEPHLATARWPARAPIDLAVPVGGPISSGYGYRWGRLHEGIDIASSHGYAVRAAASGVVRYAGYRGTYGNLIILAHEQDTETYYGHLSRILVKAGQKVERGVVIGRVGSTGHSTGPHLHFEVRVRGRPLDPSYVLGLKFG